MLTRRELLRKYDVPGPRYTSYPTVPAWMESVTHHDYEDFLEAISGEGPLSLYFHLPFCEKLCHFCGCFKLITKDHSRSGPYVAALLREIRLVGARLKNSGKKVSQIHFGGGTPNFIQPSELTEIMGAVRQEFEIMDDAEIAIEMHPRTSTKEFCDNLAKEGFNRISLGVQDFDDDVQQLINRHQTFAMTRDMLEHLRDIGFKNFNFDLVYGLPGQTEKKFQDTLVKTDELSPDRLAVYSYAHVPWKSHIQRAFKENDLPSPETKLNLFEMAYRFFTGHGYFLVGMDHFAKESDELYHALKTGGIHRNFMGYSTRANAHQIGFGVSSISFVHGGYFQNDKSVDAYQSSMSDGRLYTYRGCLLSPDDRIRREIITDLMCRFKVNKSQFEERFGILFDDYFRDDLVRLEGLVKDGLLEVLGGDLAVTDLGRIFVRNVAMCFDAYLEGIRKDSGNPVFSRTV